LLERVGGGSPQLCFVHRQFQEFAAARALRRRPPQKIVEHVARVGRVPGWQEPLVLAAGLGAAEPLVQALVESDDPSSPLSLEALTAARAELETGAISPDRADLLASALEDRMKSPVPLLAYEAGELAVRLAREAPSSFARIARGLSAHTQEWTRAIGWTLRAVTKDLETEELGNALERGILDDFVCRQVLFRAEHSVKEASTLRTEFARTAIAWLLEQEDAMANKVLRSVCVRTDFPVGLAREFRDQLVARGLGDPLKIDAAKLAESVAFLPNMIGNARAGEIAFLESVLAACGPGPSSSPRAPELEPDRSPLTLRRLATSIGLNQHAAASDLDAIRIDEGKPILEVVIRGAVVAMGLDRSSLRSEAELALAGVSEDRERRSSLWWMGYGESEELDWDRASAELRPSSELLARGLHHPSRVIAVCALHLLAAGSKDEGIRAVRAQLGAYRSFGLLLATHACLHWGEPAIVAILERCEARLDPPTESMLELLPEADAHQDRVRAILHRGLLAGDTKVAASAARGLSRLLPLGPTDQEHIRSAFEYWLGSEPPEVIDYVVQHSPRPDLVRAGLVAGAFQPADLVDMLSDSRSDVKGAAREALAELAGRDSSLATELVDRIVSGELPPVLLEALAKGQALPHAEQSPVQLLKSPQSGVRRVALEILARGAELPVASANQVWELLEDPAPEIRNIAARLLRDRSWERPET
ncbi:MAG TPA: hypothetical protein DEA08_16040, partial [Planctomycetes bacterium]|nr:hypothetical protein [Planctomycetota bacterium]